MKAKVLAILFIVFVLFSGISNASQEARVLRFPAIYDDKIVFTFARDLYTVASTGGFARKLTGHDGFEIFSRFSPDGELIAFTGEYDGNRTWGGVVGIRGFLPLVDGGFPRRPEFASYSADGKEWIIEGIGVGPDIYVHNNPAKEYAGEDEQLNKAIEVILEELKS